MPDTKAVEATEKAVEAVQNTELKGQLTEQLQSVLNWVEQSARQGTDFVTAQAPLVVEEIVQWEIASSALGIMIGFVFLIAGACATRFFYQKMKDVSHPMDVEPSLGLMIVLGVLPTVGGFIAIFAQTYNLLYALVAPRLLVIDYLRGLV